MRRQRGWWLKAPTAATSHIHAERARPRPQDETNHHFLAASSGHNGRDRYQISQPPVQRAPILNKTALRGVASLCRWRPRPRGLARDLRTPLTSRVLSFRRTITCCLGSARAVVATVMAAVAAVVVLTTPQGGEEMVSEAKRHWSHTRRT